MMHENGCPKECVYCDKQCVVLEGHTDLCRCLEHMATTEASFKKPKITITVTIGETTVSITRPMLAELPTDNEENAARMADQLVRAAVQRHYTK